MRILVLAAALSMLLPNFAYADFYTGNDLLRFCTVRESDPIYFQSDARCAGFIVGAADGAETIGLYLDVTRSDVESHQLVCIPQGVTVGQLQEIVVAALRANPENRHQSASLLVLAALKKRLPL